MIFTGTTRESCRNSLIRGRLMVHCCIFYVFRQCSTVQCRNVGVGNAYRRGNQILILISLLMSTHCSRWAAIIELATVERWIAVEEFGVWAANRILLRILVFVSRNSRINFFRFKTFHTLNTSNQRGWIGVVLKVDVGFVLDWSLWRN